MKGWVRVVRVPVPSGSTQTFSYDLSFTNSFDGNDLKNPIETNIQRLVSFGHSSVDWKNKKDTVITC